MVEVKDMTNTNSFEDLYKEMNEVAFIVECDGSHDQFNLWQQWSKKSRSNVQPVSESDMLKIERELVHHFGLFTKLNDMNKKVKDNATDRIDWEEVSHGFMIVLGPYEFNGEKFPITIEIGFAIIKGHKVCFYNSPSQLVHTGIVENYMREHFQKTYDNYSRWCHVDSNNFHNCIGGLDRLDKEPRTTAYNLNYQRQQLVEQLNRKNADADKIKDKINEIDAKIANLV